jgi:ataxin-10
VPENYAHLFLNLIFLPSTVIKEWTILAIRNICEDNLENQAFIESLTKVSTAKNANLKEFIEETGVMRIKPS